MGEENTDAGHDWDVNRGVSSEVTQRLLSMARAKDQAWTGTDVREAIWKLIGPKESLLGDAGRGYGLPPEDQEDVRTQALLSVVDALLRGVEIADLEHFARHRVRCTAIDLLRRRRTVTGHEDELARTVERDDDPWRTESAVAAREATRAAREILAELSEEQREVLLRSVLEENDSQLFRSLGVERGAGREVLKKAKREFMRAVRARGLAPLLVLVALGLSARRSVATPSSRPRRAGRALLTALVAALPARSVVVGAAVVVTVGGGAVVARCSAPREPHGTTAGVRATDGGQRPDDTTSTVAKISVPDESRPAGGPTSQTIDAIRSDVLDAAVLTMTPLPTLAGKLSWDFEPTIPLPNQLWCVRGAEHADFDWNGCFPTAETCTGLLQHAPEGHYVGCAHMGQTPSRDAAGVKVEGIPASGLNARDLRAPITDDACPLAVASIKVTNPTKGWVIIAFAPESAQGLVAAGQTVGAVNPMNFHSQAAPAAALVPGESVAEFFAWAEKCGSEPFSMVIPYAIFGAREIETGNGVQGRVSLRL